MTEFPCSSLIDQRPSQLFVSAPKYPWESCAAMSQISSTVRARWTALIDEWRNLTSTVSSSGMRILFVLSLSVLILLLWNQIPSRGIENLMRGSRTHSGLDTKLSKLDTLKMATAYIAYLKKVLGEDEENKCSAVHHPLAYVIWPFVLLSISWLDI